MDLVTSVLEETNAVFTDKRAAFKGDLRYYISFYEELLLLLQFWEVTYPFLFFFSLTDTEYFVKHKLLNLVVFL